MLYATNDIITYSNNISKRSKKVSCHIQLSDAITPHSIFFFLNN
jgi:hypothetical protein